MEPIKKFELTEPVEVARILPIYQYLPIERKRIALNNMKQWIDEEFRKLHEDETNN